MMFLGSYGRVAPSPHKAPKFAGICLRGCRIALALAASTAFSLKLSASTSADFRQAANDDSGFGLQNIHWINSIIQDNNSMYFEGMSVRQRLLISGIPGTAGNHHSLLCRHQFSKGSAHAYDFLTSYAQ